MEDQMRMYFLLSLGGKAVRVGEKKCEAGATLWQNQRKRMKPTSRENFSQADSSIPAVKMARGSPTCSCCN